MSTPTNERVAAKERAIARPYNPEDRIAELEAKIAAMEAAKVKALTLKVSQKGAVSLYGLGRFPVTLYAQQWERVLEYSESIRNFILTNADSLSVK